ncbi:MAG: hypothetical protein HZB31_06675 [Nitrospirae bacterium]|nr:hypothetical protein [Nitrospirota bacterium]
MKRFVVNFDEIQKAQEDTEREAFDYFLNRKTGELIILSQDIINKAWEILSISYDDIADFEDVEPDEIPEIPEWMEDEIELALDIFMNDHDHYIRVPERNPIKTYAAMKEFAATVQDRDLNDSLNSALDGPGSFRKFKDTLAQFPKEKKRWHSANAKASKKEIEEWLKACQLTYQTMSSAPKAC